MMMKRMRTRELCQSEADPRLMKLLLYLQQRGIISPRHLPLEQIDTPAKVLAILHKEAKLSYKSHPSTTEELIQALIKKPLIPSDWEKSMNPELFGEMENAKRHLKYIFDNPIQVKRLERSIERMISLLSNEGIDTHIVEKILSRPTKTHEDNILRLEKARQELHLILKAF
jgi:hypothetical protein